MTTLSPEIEQQIAELIAAYEIAMARLNAREKNLDEHFELSEKFLNEQIEKVNALMADLREVMTEAGAARMRLSMQEALKLGEAQLSTLKKLNTETESLMSDSCIRFEKTSNSTVKNVNEAINAFKIDDFKNFVEQSYEQVKNNSIKTVDDVSKILRWFHWKNLSLALGLSLVVAVVIGLYINAEWPWEIHQSVVKERAAGKALMNAWPHLGKDDQAFLEKKILKTTK
jgi:hypothetical protein